MTRNPCEYCALFDQNSTNVTNVGQHAQTISARMIAETANHARRPDFEVAAGAAGVPDGAVVAETGWEDAGAVAVVMPHLHPRSLWRPSPLASSQSWANL